MKTIKSILFIPIFLSYILSFVILLIALLVSYPFLRLNHALKPNLNKRPYLTSVHLFGTGVAYIDEFFKCK